MGRLYFDQCCFSRLTRLVDQEIHWPIACKLSHPTWCYSANQICAFQVINIATLNMDRWKRWTAGDRQRDKWAIQGEKTERWVTEKNNSTSGLSELIAHVPPELLGLLVHKRAIYWWRVVQECMSTVAETLLHGKQKQKLNFAVEYDGIVWYHNQNNAVKNTNIIEE